MTLEFPNRVAEGSPEYEVHHTGYHDFWFRNPSPKPLELGLENKTCKCSEVKVLLLKPGEETAARVSQVAEAAGGALPAAAAVARLNGGSAGVLDQPARWQTLFQSSNFKGEPVDTGNVVAVPGHATGFIRLSWDGRQAGPQRLAAKVWVQKPGDPRSRGGDTSLEVPVLIVSPVHAQPTDVPAFVLEPNQYHPIDVYCWSSTRPEFKLTAREETGHPCFVTDVTRVTGEEVTKVAAELNNKYPPRMQCLYRVRVTVYERRPAEKAQLDLGFFRRRIVLTTDQPDVLPITVTVTGTVRGDVTVGGGASRDKIELGTFRASQGTTARVAVRTHQAGMKLAVDSKNPEYVEAKLPAGPKEDGEWELQVRIPPGLAAGQMPPESAVILRLETQPPRLIRIPISGRAKPG